MPYWDWAMAVQGGSSVLPASMQAETVQVINPTSSSQPVEMKNPLYNFDFHPLNPSPGDFPLRNVSSFIVYLLHYSSRRLSNVT